MRCSVVRGFAAAALGTSSVFGLVAPVSVAHAQTNVRNFNIPAQDLASALEAFGRQSGNEIIFDRNALVGKRSNRIVGSYAPRAALEILLSNSGHAVRAVNEGTFAVVPQSPAAPSNIKTGFDAGSPPLTGAAPEPISSEPADEIVVTGTNIRGATNPAAPSIVITREEFERTGASTVEEVFARLPQNLNEVSTAGGIGQGVSRIASMNSQKAAGISLRGLGPGSTLVLVNGERRPGNVMGQVVDVSAIPASAIERVEIATGGSSAIYGSDAVGGVVNLITRRTFNGAETQVYVGAPEHEGGERIQASQVLGKEFDDGGFILTYDYARDWAFNVVDAGVTRESPFGIVPLTIQERPARTRHSAMFSGRWTVADGVELYSDVLFSRNRNRSFLSYSLPDAPDYSQRSSTRSEQYSGVVGARFDFRNSWQLEVTANHGAADSHQFSETNSTSSRNDAEASLTSLSAVADGPLFEFGGVRVRTAFGVERRREELAYRSGSRSTTAVESGRTVQSLFGEILVSAVDDAEQAGLNHLELSLAGRYDHYNDFGGTFNPQIGLVWKPVSALTVRGTYSEAFRAPDLFNLAQPNQAFLIEIPDPVSPSGASPALVRFGGNPNLSPEAAETWSVGLDLEPVRGTRFSLSYYEIDYRKRVDTPLDDFFLALAEEEFLGELVNRSPSAANLSQIIRDTRTDFVNLTGVVFDPVSQSPLDVFPNVVLVDNRQNNIGEERVRGVDVQFNSHADVDIGRLLIQANGTYYLDLDRRAVSGAPFAQFLNRPGKPVDFRLRGMLGLERSAFGAFVYVNYTDSYRDDTVIPSNRIASWTTVDFTLRYDGSSSDVQGVLRDASVVFSVQNLFNARPPVFANNDFGLGFDVANASALGRFFSVRLAKRW